MHKYVLKFFGGLKSFWHFLKIVCIFLIMLLLLYWIQNLTHANWEWLGFITPFFDKMLKFSDDIYSFSFNFWGALFELKYLTSVIIILAVFYCFDLITKLTDFVQEIYENTRNFCKKTEQDLMNKSLKRDIEKQEKKLNKYVVTIHTQVKKKFLKQGIKVDLNEQNQILNKFLIEQFETAPVKFEDGFLYSFHHFNEIDKILEVLFKVLKSEAPINYAICIQIGDMSIKNINQIKKLISLEHFGQITMAADTSFRYEFNKTHNYKTSQLGVFQHGETTLEVHEFLEIEQY